MIGLSVIYVNRAFISNRFCYCHRALLFLLLSAGYVQTDVNGSKFYYISFRLTRSRAHELKHAALLIKAFSQT